MEFPLLGHTVYAYPGGVSPRPGLPTLLFFHGAAHDHSVWTLYCRYFSHHGINALAVDLPGHGRSGGAPLESIEALADWGQAVVGALPALLGEAGPTLTGPLFLAGHSMGSLMALECAARLSRTGRPPDGLILIGSAIPMAVSDTLLAAARDKPEAAHAMINQWSHAPASLLGGQPPGTTGAGTWLAGMNLALMRRARPGALHRDLANCQAYTTGLEAAAQVGCPTLVVIGERDLMTPARAAQAVLGALPVARAVTIAGAGHAMLAERSDSVLDALIPFLANPGQGQSR